MLVGYDTTFEEDVYRVQTLHDLGVNPYVMIYNQIPNEKLKHFARWVNSRIYKKYRWDEYTPWLKAQSKMQDV